MDSCGQTFPASPCLDPGDPDPFASTEPTGQDDEAYNPGQLETPLEGYDPSSFSKEMETLDGMQKALESVKQRVNENYMRTILLNTDVVTMFDPITSEELKSIVMDCNNCADKIAEMQSMSMDELQDSVVEDENLRPAQNDVDMALQASSENTDQHLSNNTIETDEESTMLTECTFRQPPSED